MKVETLTPVVPAAPGSLARWRLRIENDETAPVGYQLRVIGFDPAHVLLPPPTPPLAAGASAEIDLDLAIPEAFAAGHHSLAVELVPDRAGVAPVIAAVTVTVGTVDDVALAVVPSTIRAHRRASFRLDIDNRSAQVVEVDLAGEGPDLQIRMLPERVTLRPGERVRTSGKVRGPRHLTGEPRQHSMTVTARSRSAPSYAPATFQQRPLLPRGLRSLLAILLVVGIWAGALGAGILWWNSRQDEAAVDPAAELVDTDGDGIADTPGNQLVDTDGDGVADTLAAVVAEEVAAGGGQQEPPQEGGSDRPTRTVLGGTVQSGDSGDPSGVDVTLTPIELGAAPPDGAAPAGFAGAPAGFARAAISGDGGGDRGKVWPARFGLYQPIVRSGVRQTESVPSTTATDERGAWLFGDVAVGQSYEVSFAREGFDTQAFVVTPTGDGEPIELAVELQPASGSVGGAVVGPGGGLGTVELVLTDGTLTFHSASASGAGAGAFSFTGVSTPGTYTLTANRRGFGTEVLQVTLAEGEQLGGVTIGMRAGVGSISGRVTEDGQPLGGVTLTASNGDRTVETTSLTEGDRGSYTFPRLDIPGRYTVTAALDGYVTQTRLVDLGGNATGVDFDFRKTTGVITGLVSSSNGGGLPGANVRVSRDELAFDTQTASSGDPGSFTIRDLPPGTYRVEFSRYDHAPQSQVVTIAAGQVVDLGEIVLQFRPRPAVTQNGSLEVEIVDSEATPLTGATVRLVRLSDGTVVAERADADQNQSSFVFQPVPIGTYEIRVTKPNEVPGRASQYRQSTRRVSIGLGAAAEVIPLFKLGQASGRLVDSGLEPTDDGYELFDYDIQIFRITPGAPDTLVQSIPVRTDERVPGPDGTLQIRWETAEASLTSGRYRVHVANPPPGYSVVPDQSLVDELPPMQFDILPNDDTPLDLGDIEADRFPELTGAVLVPRLAGTATAFDAIDDDDLGVALTCPGMDGVAETLEARPPADLPPGLPDELFDGVADSGSELDSYFLSPVLLESNDMFGACQLAVSAPGYVTRTIDVTIQAVRGVHSRIDRNVALFEPTDVGGDVFWLDDGVTPNADVPAGGVTVRAQGTVTVEFAPGDAPLTSDGEPTAVPGTVTPVTSDADGVWMFPNNRPKQVFGRASYVFELPSQYTARTIGLAISRGLRTATQPDPQPVPALVLELDGRGVQLDAVGGVITAAVDIATIKGTTEFDGSVVDVTGFSVDLTGANQQLDMPLSLAGPVTGGEQPTEAVFTTTPDPGSHVVDVTAPADGPDGRPLFDATSATTLDLGRQLPGQDVTADPITFVERGSADVGVLGVDGSDPDTDPDPIDGVIVRLTRVSAPATQIDVTTTGAANVVTGLPVSATVGEATLYTVAIVSDSELDLSTARLRVFDENETLTRDCLMSTPDCPTVQVRQGGRPRVEISVERYGSITGSVLAVNGTVLPIDPDGLSVTAQRIADDGCTVLSEPDAELTATAAGGGFRFAGLEGLYRITPRHDNYEDTPVSGPPQEAEDICMIRNPDWNPFDPLSPEFIQDPELTGYVFRVTNDDPRTLATPWRLQPKRSAVTVEVLADLLDPDDDEDDDGVVGEPVIGATVHLVGTDTDLELPTLGNGQAVFTGILHGAYTITVSMAGHYTVEFSLSFQEGGDPVTIRVPLPRVGAAIIGTVVARNDDGDLVPLPAGVVVTDSYDPPDPAATGATVGTVAPDPGTHAEPVVADPAVPLGYEYTLEPVESGVHTLSFTDITAVGLEDAYTTPGDLEVTVLGLTDEPAGEARYLAANRRVVVTVTSANPAVPPEGATVRLTHPDGDNNPLPCVRLDATRCTATFEAVPPEVVAYGILVIKDRFADGTGSVAVPPGDPEVDVPAPVTISGNAAVIEGAVARQGATGDPVALATGTASLQRVGAPDPPQTSPIVAGEYSFDVTARGLYRLTVSGTGVARRNFEFRIDSSGPSPPLVGDLGQEITLQQLVVPQLARFNITVQGSPVAAADLAVQVTGSPPEPPAVSDTSTGFTVLVDPGFGDPAPPRPTYGFTVTSTAGYVPFPIAAQQIGIGATDTEIAAMVARTIAGTVTGATAAVTVRARQDGETIGATVSTTGSFTLPGPFPAGDYTIEAAALGVGFGPAAAEVAADDSPNVTGVLVAVGPRQVAIDFTTTPDNVRVAITGGTSGTATDGELTLTQPETDATINWTANLDGWVTQTGSAPLNIAETDPFAPALTRAAAIPIALARPLMSAIVHNPSGVAVINATVVMCPGATGACTSGTTGFVPLPYVAARSRYEGRTNTVDTWRIAATHAMFDPVAPLPTFTVAANGTITPTPPVTLTLETPT